MIKNKSIIVKLDTNEGCNCNSIKDIQLAIKENRDIVTSLTYAIDNTYILKGITILHEQNKSIKPYSKKRAKLERERYSILTNDLNKCYICGAKENIHIHEIYFGKNRQNSMKYGCCVPLCFYHHNGSKHAVHYDKYLDDLLKEECQRKFEKEHSREEFISIFGRSYL